MRWFISDPVTIDNGRDCRTLSGLDTLRLGEQARERSHSLTIGGGPGPGGGALNNLSQTPRTPCTPTFATEKDAITNFVDFNPAGGGLKLFMPSARQDKAAEAGVES